MVDVADERGGERPHHSTATSSDMGFSSLQQIKVTEIYEQPCTVALHVVNNLHTNGNRGKSRKITHGK